MLDVKTVQQVMEILKNEFADFPLDSELTELHNCTGRILAETVFSSEDVPGFNRSNVDGYAVISSDTFGAGESQPVQLNLLPEVLMGQYPDFALSKGQSCYVPTGGALPQYADSVVMIEYSEDYKDGTINLFKSSAPGNNVTFKGDDVRVAQPVVLAGTLLRPQEVGALAAIGCDKVSVFKKIKIAIISTGDEVVEVKSSIKDCSKIRDINSYTLYSGILSQGCIPVVYGIVKDNYDLILDAASRAMGECDIVLISGGSSVGTRDETYKVIDKLSDSGILVHGIAVKPGKPTIIGKSGNKALIGLPGHPVSAYMIFKIFVVELISQMEGLKTRQKVIVDAVMKGNYPSNNGREEFLPVKIEETDGKTIATPVFGKSGLITSLVMADGFVHIARGAEGLSASEPVKVVLF